MTAAIQILAIIGLSALGVLADMCIKVATTQRHGLVSKWFLLGILIYTLLGAGWFPVLKHVKLSTVGVVYAVCTTLLLVAGSVVIFHERLTTQEVIALLFGLTAVALLMKFA